MKIKDLLELQKENDRNIKAVADSIHPKLLSVLNYQDIFNDEFKNDEFQKLYTALVEPKIRECAYQFNEACNEFLYDYVNDMNLILESTGYYLDDGSESYSFTNNKIPTDYIPCVEIAPVWDAVRNLKFDYSYRPFWQREGYCIIGNAETINVSSHSSPSYFITENRAKFTRSYGKSNMEMLLLSLNQREDLFDYPIYVQPLTLHQDKNIPTNLADAVRRHLILRKAMETKETMMEYTSCISSIKEDGTIQLLPEGYY